MPNRFPIRVSHAVWLLATAAFATGLERCDGGDEVQMLQALGQTTQLLARQPQPTPESKTMPFPRRELPEPVAKDSGNTTRKHVFVVGPEGSSTRFWSRQLAAGLNLMDPDSNAFYLLTLGKALGSNHCAINNEASVCHLSLPFQFSCQNPQVEEEPIVSDFGGAEGAFDYMGQEAVPMNVPEWFRKYRFFVDPLEVVQSHRRRGDEVMVLLVMRDPRASMQDKATEKHCSLPALSRQEQKLSFELMLKAFRAADKDIHVACYEEAVQQGESYQQDKLRSMDIPTVNQTRPFFDGNAKYQLPNHDCESDTLAYAELCPNTDLGKIVKAECSGAA